MKSAVLTIWGSLWAGLYHIKDHSTFYILVTAIALTMRLMWVCGEAAGQVAGL